MIAESFKTFYLLCKKVQVVSKLEQVVLLTGLTNVDKTECEWLCGEELSASALICLQT